MSLNSINIENAVWRGDYIVKYVLCRFENLKKELTRYNLILFHTNNKFLVMSHNQEKLQVLGNIVVNHQKKSSDELIKYYEVSLWQALSTTPTIKQHINVIIHIYGYFSNDFDHIQKRTFLNLLEQFRKEKTSLGDIL